MIFLNVVHDDYIADSFQSEATRLSARYPVDRTVQFKMDFFEGWLQAQSERDRSIILDLATGETTGAVARKYGVSDGLISQYRKRSFPAAGNSENGIKLFLCDPCVLCG